MQIYARMRSRAILGWEINAVVSTCHPLLIGESTAHGTTRISINYANEHDNPLLLFLPSKPNSARAATAEKLVQHTGRKWTQDNKNSYHTG